MIVIDVNLLIYAVNKDAPDHRQAKAWLETTLSGQETVGLPWILLAFLRLVTRPGLFRKPLAVDTAFDLIASWLQQPSVIVPEPTPRHFQTMRDLLTSFGTGGNLTSDAYLATLALEHGAGLCSTDRDFARFRRLRCRNPLLDESTSRPRTTPR